jgi:hypothetical protein
MLIRSLGVMVSLAAGASQLQGQSPVRTSASSEALAGQSASAMGRDWQLWLSLGSVTGSASAPELPAGRRGNGGNLAAWGTYGLAALCLRTTAIPLMTDMTSGIGDHAALLGAHLPLRAHEDFVIAVGGGQSFGTGYLVPLRREGMFEGAAEFNLNYRFVGLGIDAFMANGRTRHYAGWGVSLSFGRFR